MSADDNTNLKWYRVLDPDELPEARVGFLPIGREAARLCGAMGIRVTAVDELDDAISRALAHDGPGLVEVVSDAQLV